MLRERSIRDIALAHLALAMVEKCSQRIEEADSHLRQAVDSIRLSHRQDEGPLAFLLRAELSRFEGSFDAAQSYLREAIRLAKRGRMRLLIADCFIEACQLRLESGKGAKAAGSLDAAQEISLATGYKKREVEIARLADRIPLGYRKAETKSIRALRKQTPIDVTSYDKSGSSAVAYRFTEAQFCKPLETLEEFAKNPSLFHKGDYQIRFTREQESSLLAYLRRGQDYYFRQSFGQPCHRGYVLALSFGENPDVNGGLATEIQRLIQRVGQADIYAQHEVADILCDLDGSFRGFVRRIDLDEWRDYMTTFEVIQKFVTALSDEQGRNHVPVFLVAQAWHAPRIIRICQREESLSHGLPLRVVGGSFVDRFSPNDPQPWVRNAFAWILKEGTTRT